jgi:hypothetical protein
MGGEAVSSDATQARLDEQQSFYLGLLKERDDRLAELEARLERVGRGCMLALACIEAVPYWNGMKQVSIYEAFDRYWIGTLQSEDMTYLRRLMGVPEPGTEEGRKWMEANR